MSVAGPVQRHLARLRTAQQLRLTAVNGNQRNTVAGHTGYTFAIRRKGTGLWPQTKTLGAYRARLATLEIHNVHPRGVTGFVAVEQQALGIGEELPMVGNNVPGGRARSCPTPVGSSTKPGGDMFCRNTSAHLPS